MTVSSREAFCEATEDGTISGAKKVVYDCIKRLGRAATHEIINELSNGRENTGKYTARLTELEKAGVIEVIDRTLNPSTGKMSSVYQLTGKKPVFLTYKQRLKRMGCKNHEEYCLTKHWRDFVVGYFTRNPRVCFVTGSTINLDLHHTHYETVGEEVDADVVPLNRKIHKTVHQLVDELGIPLATAHLAVKMVLVNLTDVESRSGRSPQADVANPDGPTAAP